MNCDIVKDLYGIYMDGCASKSTEIMIKNHLKRCPECKEFYRDVPFAVKRSQTSEAFGDYTVIAKRIKKRRACVTLGVLSGFALLTAWALAETIERRSK